MIYNLLGFLGCAFAAIKTKSKWYEALLLIGAGINICICGQVIQTAFDRDATICQALAEVKVTELAATKHLTPIAAAQLRGERLAACEDPDWIGVGDLFVNIGAGFIAAGVLDYLAWRRDREPAS